MLFLFQLGTDLCCCLLAIFCSLIQENISAKMAVNDSHINNVAHALIGRVHQILSKSSANRPILTLITSRKPTGQPSVQKTKLN